MEYKIVAVRDNPELLDRAVKFFSSVWSIPEETYRESITESLDTISPVPRWYLMFKEDDIVGSFGIIENDFVDSSLTPYLCALYVDPNERGQALGARLLMYGQNEAGKLGYDTLYLVTDHVGYYEKYGWEFDGMVQNTGETTQSRLYKIGTDD